MRAYVEALYQYGVVGYEDMIRMRIHIENHWWDGAEVADAHELC